MWSLIKKQFKTSHAPKQLWHLHRDPQLGYWRRRSTRCYGWSLREVDLPDSPWTAVCCYLAFSMVVRRTFLWTIRQWRNLMLTFNFTFLWRRELLIKKICGRFIHTFFRTVICECSLYLHSLYLGYNSVLRQEIRELLSYNVDGSSVASTLVTKALVWVTAELYRAYSTDVQTFCAMMQSPLNECYYNVRVSLYAFCMFVR